MEINVIIIISYHDRKNGTKVFVRLSSKKRARAQLFWIRQILTSASAETVETVKNAASVTCLFSKRSRCRIKFPIVVKCFKLALEKRKSLSVHCSAERGQPGGPQKVRCSPEFPFCRQSTRDSPRTIGTLSLFTYWRALRHFTSSISREVFQRSWNVTVSASHASRRLNSLLCFRLYGVAMLLVRVHVATRRWWLHSVKFRANVK